MYRRISWFLVSGLILAALLLISCGQGVTEEGKEAASPSQISLKVGETARTSKITVTVSDIIIADSYEYYSQTEGKTVSKEAPIDISFLIATVEIENVGKTEESGGAQYLTAFDDQSRHYRIITPYMGEDRLKLQPILKPGEKVKGKVLFSMPKGATGLKIAYDFSSYNTNLALAEWEIE
jgi:hypothetical protein